MANASAALGIIGRTGLGKLRHVNTSYLWLQQESIKDKLMFDKALGTNDPVDINTKGLIAEVIRRYVDRLSMEHEEGRAELSPNANRLINEQMCIIFHSTSKLITKRNRLIKNRSN